MSLATLITSSAAEAAQAQAFWQSVLPELARQFQVEGLTIVGGHKGAWESQATFGALPALPTDLLADAIDRGSLQAAAGWFAAPLGDTRHNRVLAGRSARPLPKDFAERLPPLIEQLAAGITIVEHRERSALRIERLQAILLIAAQWNRTQHMDDLLRQMAEAATKLFDCERASIFLWDKPRKRLVGRPALGVEGGELRIPDTTGVVGQVVHSGQPHRVDQDETGEINRTVDEKLKFRTRNLLCVPLLGTRGSVLGAFELINKRHGDFTVDDQDGLIELAAHAAIALTNTQQHEQLVKVRDHVVDEAAQGARLIGQSPAIEALRGQIQRIAATDLAVLLLGENGTGKEVVSKRIHYQSERRNEPFVAVNCAALPETLLESELFGHEKGAFTDAQAMRQGKFELASGGTLFLDEIGDMSLGGQAKLLRVLEEKVVVRVGGSLPIHTDARVLAATNQDLPALVRAKKFREDLYFRLTVVTLTLPPLRERGDDILLLAEHFLHEFSVKARRIPPQFSAAARKRLLQHRWPGNIRELRNLMERIAYLSPGETIDVDELAFILSPSGEDTPRFSLELPLTEATQQFQIDYIKKQIELARGSMTEAAERLGLHRSNLYRKMKQLGMPTSE